MTVPEIEEMIANATEALTAAIPKDCGYLFFCFEYAGTPYYSTNIYERQLTQGLREMADRIDAGTANKRPK